MTGISVLLDALLDDMERAPDLYRPTNFWDTGLGAIVDDLRERGVESFRRHDSALRMYVPSYGADRKHRLAARVAGVVSGQVAGKLRNDDLAAADYRVFRAADRPGALDLGCVTESGHGGPLEQYAFEGRAYSRPMLNYLRGLTLLKQVDPDFSPSVTLEIGGGFGTLGELLGQAAPGSGYVDVDIPPVNVVAAWYLEQTRGSVRDYLAHRGDEEIKVAAGEVHVLAPWQLPAVTGDVDLFVNFISFQEMEPHVVANYAHLVADLGPRYLLLRNSRDGKPVARKAGDLGVVEQVTRQTYLDVFDAYDLVASDSMVFGEWTPRGASEVMVFRRR